MKIKWNRVAAQRGVKTVYRNKWFKINNRNGYYSLEYGFPQVAILPVIEDTHLLMIKTKRPLIRDITLELPGGGSETGETPAETARRELAEETGIEIGDLRRFRLLPLLSPLPERSSELMISYGINLSWEEYRRRGKTDKVTIKVLPVVLQELKKKIVSGEIYQTSTIALVARHLFVNGIE